MHPDFTRYSIRCSTSRPTSTTNPAPPPWARRSHALLPGLAIHLHGDLGAKQDRPHPRPAARRFSHVGHVKSPTYTLSEPYRIELDGQTVNVIHFDLYRMSSPEEFLDAGFREDFNANNICIVEWPEKAEPVLPPPDLNVWLHVAGHGRDVELQALSDLGLLCLDRLKFAPNL
ncbi:tRNA (adenosine(37)-N6)-threonylcarbamoyltransferase complex ATPase subunit type 1 TsaE [Massilia sp. B-10]|nr:tRNA (adenosine(37)-N6)-threonylcarbamoyltransferase complex ATPase subunit type 1 TsaE [Massilia sp. B-10]